MEALKQKGKKKEKEAIDVAVNRKKKQLVKDNHSFFFLMFNENVFSQQIFLK
jgi:hypothetical protein